MFAGILVSSQYPKLSNFLVINGGNRDLISNNQKRSRQFDESFIWLEFCGKTVNGKTVILQTYFVTLNNQIMSNMHLSFQLKKSKADKSGKSPIYVRITVNGNRTEFSIKRSISQEKWISSAGVAKGTNEESRSLNSFLSVVRLKINDHHRQMLEAEKMISAEAIRNAYLGIGELGRTLCEVFEYHNKQVKELIGKDFAFGTYERYTTALSHLKDFILWKFKVSDIEVKRVSLEFITEFEFYLKTQRKCGHNTAIKYITNFKKIIRICLGNGWIEKDPFLNYKISLREVERECLTQEELDRIADKEIRIPRLDQVRDIFLFCCFTGLAYADVQKLSKEHIVTGIDGEKWIKVNRTKTDTKSQIPLLPIPLAILEKYSIHPKCISNGKLLPVLSNQKMNGYLKEIADICSIEKKVSFHLARHSFATTITLTNGVPLESVSKMLGHKSIKTTQHYAKIVDRKVSEDMRILKEKFGVNVTPKKVLSNEAC